MAKPLSPYENIPLPPQAPPSAGWGQRIENALVRFLIGVLNAAFTGIQNILAWGFQHFTESFEAGLIDVLARQAGELTDDPDTPDEVRTILSEMISGSSQGGVATLAGFGAQMGMGISSGFMAPLLRLLSYKIDKKKHTARMDPAAAIAAVWRSGPWNEQAAQGLRELGWSDELILAWTTLLARRLPEADLLQWSLRNPGHEGEVTDELKLRGWNSPDDERLVQLTQIIPNVTDLIRMAVREAFNDEVAARFEYDADFPAEVDEWAQKQGLAPEWSKRYWRSHWELPSVQAGFEMLHRLRPGTTDTPFTADDLLTLLRTADIPRFFRDRLMQVSYNPYTRVDIRRMFKLGILDQDGVKSAYLDGGYDEEHAENLTKFTLMDVSSAERDLTRGAVITGYKRALMTRDDAKAQLLGFGYDDNEAEFWLSLADWEIQAAALDEAVSRVKFLYTNGEIEMGQVYAELGPFNLPAIQVQNYLKQWDVLRRNKVALPSERDLFDFYQLNIIDLGVVQLNLQNKGYSPERIDWLTRRNDLEQAEKASKEAALAQAEQERIAKAEAATAYQKATAAIDVTIAQYRVAIADRKLALHDIEKGPEQEAVKKEIAEIQVFIAEEQQTKAELKVTPPEPAA